MTTTLLADEILDKHAPKYRDVRSENRLPGGNGLAASWVHFAFVVIGREDWMNAQAVYAETGVA